METERTAYTSAARLKASARQCLWGNLGVTIRATLLFLLIYALVFFFVSPQSDGIFGTVWLQIATILIRLLSGVFVSGSAFLYLNLIYGKNASIKDLFHGFKEEPNKAILLQLVFICAAMVANVPLLIYDFTAASYSFGIDLALTLLTPVLTFVLTLPFSQAYYLLQDFPDRDVRSLIRASARLMQGQKLRLSLLALSFLPLFLLCVVTFFLPLLWLRSYYNATMAAFYKDLVGGDRDGSA